jgi:hypothetical protein
MPYAVNALIIRFSAVSGTQFNQLNKNSNNLKNEYMRRQYQNEKCNCGSGKKYKNCCGKSGNSKKYKNCCEPPISGTKQKNCCKTPFMNKIEDRNIILDDLWDYSQSIPTSELVKSLQEFVKGESSDLTIFLMGDTDYVYCDITKNYVEKWFTNYADFYLNSFELDYKFQTQQLGSKLGKDSFDFNNGNYAEKQPNFFLSALCCFLQSATYKDYKALLLKRTVVITFFKNENGFYSPHVIGLACEHPTSPTFFSEACSMIKLCLGVRRNVYKSQLVDLILKVPISLSRKIIWNTK